MDSREIDHVLRGKLGTLVEYKGVFTADTMPRIVFNIKPIVFITNILSSTSDISNSWTLCGFLYIISP